ncbi:hypothetical protein D9M69_581690 [compost metagenome]
MRAGGRHGLRHTVVLALKRAGGVDDKVHAEVAQPLREIGRLRIDAHTARIAAQRLRKGRGPFEVAPADK